MTYISERLYLCLLPALCLLPIAGYAQKGDVSPDERVSVTIGEDGDFPARQIKIGTPALRLQRIESDEFNSFVPGLSTIGRLTLDPRVDVPYLHIPYLRNDDSFEDQDIVIGRVFGLKLSVDSSFIFTDNVYRKQSKQSDLIVQAVLGITATLQLTENLQLLASGNIAYYRAMGKSDVSAYGFRDEFYFGRSLDFDPDLSLDGSTLFVSMFDWNRQKGAWGFGVADRFSVTDRLMAEPFVDGKFERTTELANSAWASIGRILPTQSRVGLLLRHTDYWYPGDFDNWDRVNDEGILWFVVDRDNARLRPFAEYKLKSVRYSNSSSRDGVVHEGKAGVAGEVTDQLNARASIGYGLVEGKTSSQDSQSFVWDLAVDHLMNSRTREQLVFSRRFADSGQSSQAVDDSLQYRLGRTLGRDFTIWLGLSKFRRDPSGNETVDSKNWSALVDLNRDFAHNWNVSLRYEYVDWDSNIQENSFNENRVTIGLAWNKNVDRQQYSVDKDFGLPDTDDVDSHVVPEFDDTMRRDVF